MRLAQFRLRSLLVVIVLVAMGLGMLGRQTYEARRQRAVVADLVSQGAFVTFSERKSNLPGWLDTDYASSVSGVDLDGSQVSELRLVAEFTYLDFLGLSGAQIDDISPLAGLRCLQVLTLDMSQVSDLSPLIGLKGLEEVYVTDATDEQQLASLRKALPNCLVIDIW